MAQLNLLYFLAQNPAQKEAYELGYKVGSVLAYAIPILLSLGILSLIVVLIRKNRKSI